MPYLVLENRGRIVGMRQAGLPFRAISHLVGIPLSTVYDMVAKFQLIGTVRTQKKTGRPPIMTDRDRRELDRIITQGRRLMVAQVTDLMTRTIQRKIHKLGKHSRIAPKKPYLRPQDFQCCLAFAQAHRHWTINNWAWVVWTDESAFKLGKKVNRVRVWRTPREPRRQPSIGPSSPHDGSTSLPTGPASVHSLDGAGPLDSWSPPHPFDGGQCPHPHSPSKRILVSSARDPEAQLAGSLARLESHRKHMENNDESDK
ncbi:hypothetical protein O181_109627 [Austropuccinia psidii MF-1]|uniref:Transposase Tc1-like domain-containing protein n=1 Tax=Austropuccinia psidii MF-1 TaxID=1389203 RepID=A0A9Q3JY84_9BASI|nr:hypothetical protein [Austropuccinia psidii MF-1]